MGAPDEKKDYSCRDELEEEIRQRIYKYVDMCDSYKRANGVSVENCQKCLNLNVFKVCLLSSFPESIINEYTEFIKELDWLLWDHFIEEDEKNNGLIKIAGYLALEKKQVSSFSLINILFYNHALKDCEDSDRENFLNTMILYPCYRKIMNLDENHKKEVMNYLGLKEKEAEIPREKLGDIKEQTMRSFDAWKLRLDYIEYIDVIEIAEYRTAAIEGAEMYVAAWDETKEEGGGEQDVQNK